jgi:hypothetical protein
MIIAIPIRGSLDLDVNLGVGVAAHYAVDSILVVATRCGGGTRDRLSGSVVVAKQHVAAAVIR